MFRKAVAEDLPAIAAIYDAIHTKEEQGLVTTGWIRSIYPTVQTAKDAIALGDMFVCEEDGAITSCGRINQEQVDCYKDADWQYPAPPSRVMVLHTLVVDPALSRTGVGAKFLEFYETYALSHDCPFLRIDTNERNTAARAFYKKHSYKEVAIIPCEFNGIPGVGLVLLEKKL